MPALSDLSTVLRSVFIRQWAHTTTFVVGKVLGLGGMLANDVALPGIGRITPYPGFRAMQQIRQNPAVMHIRRCYRYRMNQLALTIDLNVRLYAKEPLVALLGLMHFRVSFAFPVLGRTGRIDNGAGADRDTIVLQILRYQNKQLITQRLCASSK